MNNNILLEVKNMHKSFGRTIALKNVDLTIRRGEIRGLIGENGSGKSTVMSIVAGMQMPTSGEMTYKNKPWKPMNMIEGQKNGIAMILQEANTIPHVTVSQNIFAGQEKEFTSFGIVNMKKMHKRANELLNEFGISHIKGEDSIDYYSYEERKLVEIVRAISEETEIFIVDETTTALSHNGRAILYKLIHKLAEKNKSVVFISHDMDEILEHCHVLTVLRDGDIIGHLDRNEMDNPDSGKKIRYMMVGREIGDKYYREDYDISHSGELALELQGITKGLIKDFNLKLHKGEIIGIGGLSGCGMHDIGRIAYGLEKIDKGKVIRHNKEIKKTFDAINEGIGYISKNRDSESLILEASVKENIVLPSLSDLEKNLYISPRLEKDMTLHEIEDLRIKCGSHDTRVETLSGGNKQKVSFAKWTAKDSNVIIMDCPTRGVDIGVKQRMYDLIEQMKKENKAILMISEELPELIGMADRIIIMKDYKVTKEFNRSPELKQTDIIEYMI